MSLLSKLKIEIETGQRQFWWVPKHTPDLSQQLLICELLDKYHESDYHGSFRDFYGLHSNAGIETYRKFDISRYLGLISNYDSYDDCHTTKTYQEIKKHYNGNINQIVKHPILTDHLFEELAVKGQQQPYIKPFQILYNYLEQLPGNYLTRAEFMYVVCSTWTYQQYIDGLQIIQYVRENNIDLRSYKTYAKTTEIRIHIYFSQHSIFKIRESTIEFSDRYKPQDPLDYIEEIEEQSNIQKSMHYTDQKNISIANARVPELTNATNSSKKYKTDPRLAKSALKQSQYLCEFAKLIDEQHITFDTNLGLKYVEAHHLIPMSKQDEFFPKNLDRIENIVALCPICHRAVHYGNKTEKEKILKVLYDSKINLLSETIIDVSFLDFMEYYR